MELIEEIGCIGCNGSGEGASSSSNCSTCKGSGIVEVEKTKFITEDELDTLTEYIETEYGIDSNKWSQEIMEKVIIDLLKK